MADPMLATVILATSLAGAPAEPRPPLPRAVLPVVARVRDPREPVLGRRARRRDAALARKS